MTNRHPPTPDEIKTARTQLGLTQAELAAALLDATPEELARLNLFLAKLGAVRNWEAGKQTPDRHHTARLRRILNLD